ncbi:MAG: ECF-type sigma factor [Candidatus Eisenbacteria bacterium]
MVTGDPSPPRAGGDPGAGDDRWALDRLFDATYDELRRLAATVRRDDPRTTVTPTGLVSQAWLKLARSPEVARTSPLHFRRIAARAMRQVLIESARRRHAERRGGREAVFVTYDDALAEYVRDEAELLELDVALEELAAIAPRQAALVEARFFGGFDMTETAEQLGISEATATRDWRAARAWLGVRLRGAR